MKSKLLATTAVIALSLLSGCSGGGGDGGSTAAPVPDPVAEAPSPANTNTGEPTEPAMAAPTPAAPRAPDATGEPAEPAMAAPAPVLEFHGSNKDSYLRWAGRLWEYMSEKEGGRYARYFWDDSLAWSENVFSADGFLERAGHNKALNAPMEASHVVASYSGTAMNYIWGSGQTAPTRFEGSVSLYAEIRPGNDASSFKWAYITPVFDRADDHHPLYRERVEFNDVAVKHSNRTFDSRDASADGWEVSREWLDGVFSPDDVRNDDNNELIPHSVIGAYGFRISQEGNGPFRVLGGFGLETHSD